MNDEFLSRFRSPPRPPFAAALYQRLNQPVTMQIKPQPLPAASRLSRLFQAHGGPTMKRSFVLAAFAMAAIAALTVAFVPSAQAMLIDIIREIVLGPNTTVMQAPQAADHTPKSLPKDMWVIRTEIGNFGGNAAPGVEPSVRSVGSLEEAQALTTYPLKVPTDLPPGYALREIKLAPMWTATWVILFYGGPGHDLIIAEMPGGPQPSPDPQVAASVKTGILTDGTVEAIDFDGRRAGWIDGHALLWEAEGVSIEVGGLDLDLPGVMAIARSLR
jgi:hypothetical protein